MGPFRIFISSTQKELVTERFALREYIRNDPLMRRCFEVFLFEELPALGHRAEKAYLEEVAKCDIYIGIFAMEYGWEDQNGLSPTHREFHHATRLGKERLIYVKGFEDRNRHPKMLDLIREAGSELIRKRFFNVDELIPAVYASLVTSLEERELIRFGSFDAAAGRDAMLSDLNMDKVVDFLGRARRSRNFPLPEESSPIDILKHLDLLNKGRPNHAALLLFGNKPQRFLICSEVKCAHFHGLSVSKPIPSYQVYKGTVFELVDQATDFVLSKIDLWVGTRAESNQVPTAYEIPQEVVVEAIVNAIVHRDYTSKASVQVMLFKDRLEIWNPGNLPPSLTLDMLKQPHASVPANPLVAGPMYLAKYIERMGTGIRDMVDRCVSVGLAEPEIRIDTGIWVTTIRRKEKQIDILGEAQSEAQSGAQSEFILKILRDSECSAHDLAKRMGLKGKPGSFKRGLQQLLETGQIEYTIPDSPSSRLQKYRISKTDAHL